MSDTISSTMSSGQGSRPAFVLKEQEHYDFHARSLIGDVEKIGVKQVVKNWDLSQLPEAYQAPFQRCYGEASRYHEGTGAKVLDYCSGFGLRTIQIQQRLPFADVTGIDISEQSVRLATHLCEQLGDLPRRPSFQLMDAHQLTFPDEEFDLVMDFGSLSSLNLEKAVREVSRVLKTGGKFVGVETYGHNPILNLKRSRSVEAGRRTQWAAENIMTKSKLAILQRSFAKVKIEHYCLLSLLGELKGFRGLISSRLLTKMDELLFRFVPFTRSLAFKVVFIAEK